MEEKIIIETIPALTTIKEATSSFSLIAWFNTYEPFIIFIVKIVLTIILLILTIKTYKVFIDDLNYHKGASELYSKIISDYNLQRNKNREFWASLVQGSIGIDNQLSAARKEPTTETLKMTTESANESDKVWEETINKNVELYKAEKEAIKDDALSLLKALIIPLSAISVMWFGKPF